MRFVRFGDRGVERPGCIDSDGRIRDLSHHLTSFEGSSLDPEQLAVLARLDPSALPLVAENVRLCMPVRRIGKIVGIGPNYNDSAELAGFKINPEPTLFLKAATAASGPNDPIEIPRMANRVDWGVELAVVIGRVAKYVRVEEALRHVAGFTLANDLTERSFQLQRGGQWTKGKSHDTFAPLGPWLVPPSAINHDDIELWLDVNGERQQTGHTRQMIFKVPYLISYISRFMRLEPGDVIMTGTPGGVGLSYDPPRFLRPGDRVTLGGTGLGTQDYVCTTL
ncbi:fumarylacetoacetate hydrolase family protein [Aurantimonas endophytica]|jgi:2-keto-4-pentenoate hydratase/2-oxohepta-3-ene-1,7-dioic acid hydratase in catechol pathway|uniref:2-keto-4-pentenoate hydratase/2-oxohepta-3-ene-1,7-dioic acid hydratase in catechol pathway n=1 Tax=Aurantimonas endophytica TaxID=1522175 RepID=A0A7W6HDA9_9HYPH|nr:fumarylacetoacetate hydrolase family protein [Aurantimonas endophytica]MBB4002962.1 2-keto-4-pentenoate hydratase/2-oxohepta-3-ene-1,7-dioic acid hydratase in catechol pathway [Aurantimonas endophytica]MCO6403838.1 ureidoglycolate lyase [Aurantimonas endophytica]